MVRLQDGREFKAVDIKTDPKTDLAILRIEGAGTLPAARLGDSSKVEIGDWVLALGQPFGLEGTVTAGIVSAKDRGHRALPTAKISSKPTRPSIRATAAARWSIWTARSSASTRRFPPTTAAIRAWASRFPRTLPSGSAVNSKRPAKCIERISASSSSRSRNRWPKQFKVKVHQGVIVTEVRSNTPAAKAGLKSGDVILDFAGKAVSNPRQLQGLVEMSKVGSSEPLTILRDGKQMTLNVTCRRTAGGLAVLPAPGPKVPAMPESSHFEKLGIQVADLTASVAEHLGIKAEHGVVITDVRNGSPADLAGLSSGMVITEANRQPVKTVDDFRKALDAKSLEKGVLLLVRTAEGSRFVVIAESE